MLRRGLCAGERRKSQGRGGNLKGGVPPANKLFTHQPFALQKAPHRTLHGHLGGKVWADPPVGREDGIALQTFAQYFMDRGDSRE